MLSAQLPDSEYIIAVPLNWHQPGGKICLLNKYVLVPHHYETIICFFAVKLQSQNWRSSGIMTPAKKATGQF